MTDIKEFRSWLKEAFDSNRVVEYEEQCIPEGGAETELRVYLYTATNRYSIVAKSREDDDGYLGCIARCRKYRPGEDWHRGNDLPDGHFNKGTWIKILKGIVRYELQEIHHPAPPQADLPSINEAPAVNEASA